MHSGEKQLPSVQLQRHPVHDAWFWWRADCLYSLCLGTGKPLLTNPHTHLWILKIYQLCVHLSIIYLFSMRCLMLIRSNFVSNMLNHYCSPLDATQKRMLRPTGECSAEHLLRRLCTDWQQRRVCQYTKLLLVLVNFLLPLRTPIHVDHWRRELSCSI